MSHAAHDDEADAALSGEEADAIAEVTQALATPSRVRLLYGLRTGERSVTDLADATGMTIQAASQQLRVLRQLKLVIARRDGRTARYRLHDEHVASLLDEVRGHVRHVTLDLPAHATGAGAVSRARPARTPARR